jgi:protein phosphatase
VAREGHRQDTVTFPYFAHAAAHVGKHRTTLEDYVRAEHLPQGGIAAIVCDGMGGADGGALAARTAAIAILDAVRAQTTAPTAAALKDALFRAHEAVRAASAGTPGMGTTAAIAWCEGPSCFVGWVGDSRMYLFRGGSRLVRTTDHTKVMEMVARGELRPEQAVGHPQANVLSQALGQGNVEPGVFEQPITLAASDVVLLCSDGLYEMIPTDEEIYALIEGRLYSDAVTSLIDEANRRGANDNVGVAIVVAGERRVPKRGAR